MVNNEKNIKTKKLPPLWNQHKYLVAHCGLCWAYRADLFAWHNFLVSVGGLYRM
jgi:hypothetical protein